jgi:hypothetical protein
VGVDGIGDQVGAECKDLFLNAVFVFFGKFRMCGVLTCFVVSFLSLPFADDLDRFT